MQSSRTNGGDARHCRGHIGEHVVVRCGKRKVLAVATQHIQVARTRAQGRGGVGESLRASELNIAIALGGEIQCGAEGGDVGGDQTAGGARQHGGGIHHRIQLQEGGGRRVAAQINLLARAGVDVGQGFKLDAGTRIDEQVAGARLGGGANGQGRAKAQRSGVRTYGASNRIDIHAAREGAAVAAEEQLGGTRLDDPKPCARVRHVGQSPVVGHAEGWQVRQGDVVEHRRITVAAGERERLAADNEVVEGDDIAGASAAVAVHRDGRIAVHHDVVGVEGEGLAAAVGRDVIHLNGQCAADEGDGIVAQLVDEDVTATTGRGCIGLQEPLHHRDAAAKGAARSRDGSRRAEEKVVATLFDESRTCHACDLAGSQAVEGDVRSVG